MAVKSCPKCNEDNSATASVCINCGTSLRECEVIGNTDKPNYSYFGEQKNTDSVLCTECKEELLANTSRLLYIVTFLLPLIGLIVGGVYSTSEDTYKKKFGKVLLKFGIVMAIIHIVGIILLVNFGLG